MDDEIREMFNRLFKATRDGFQTQDTRIKGLKEQVGINCSKLDKIGKELSHVRVKIDTLCRTGNVTEINLKRIEREVIKIKKKL